MRASTSASSPPRRGPRARGVRRRRGPARPPAAAVLPRRRALQPEPACAARCRPRASAFHLRSAPLRKHDVRFLRRERRDALPARRYYRVKVAKPIVAFSADGRSATPSCPSTRAKRYVVGATDIDADLAGSGMTRAISPRHEPRPRSSGRPYTCAQADPRRGAQCAAGSTTTATSMPRVTAASRHRRRHRAGALPSSSCPGGLCAARRRHRRPRPQRSRD